MAIWKQAVPIGPIEGTSPFYMENSMGGNLGLRITEIGEDFIRGTLPVGVKTVQAYGRLHGGASCVLAEELGSIASSLCVDRSKHFVVGQEINANHVRGVREGLVTGTARPLHIGNSSQVWDIRIEDEQGRLVCISRLTVAVVPLRGDKPT